MGPVEEGRSGELIAGSVKGFGTRPYQGDLDTKGKLQPPPAGWDDGLDKLGGSKVFYPNRFGQVPFFDDE